MRLHTEPHRSLAKILNILESMSIMLTILSWGMAMVTSKLMTSQLGHG